ncbi:hypothetical protein ASD50_04000 [Mesorhizobium sp. Root552]|nr:hypothetical protein ASD50_04000 [Mesorhizobium sp. Root552]
MDLKGAGVQSTHAVIPIDTVKSIDELTCRLDEAGRHYPETLVAQLKGTLAHNVGQFITSSVGIAANPQLAKIACKVGKKAGERYGNGLMIWQPEDLPAPLFKLNLDDIPGIGSGMERRLLRASIQTVEQLYNTEPKHMRRIWRNVTGERLWYALHGYDIQAPEAERGMFGHGRVLPPESRSLGGCLSASPVYGPTIPASTSPVARSSRLPRRNRWRSCTLVNQ